MIVAVGRARYARPRLPAEHGAAMQALLLENGSLIDLHERGIASVTKPSPQNPVALRILDEARFISDWTKPLHPSSFLVGPDSDSLQWTGGVHYGLNMGVINTEMYEALIVANVPEAMAKAAAAQVAKSQDPASKDDLLALGKELRTAFDKRFAEQDKRFAEQDKRFAAIEASLAVVKFAVLSSGPLILALLMKLVFFP